MRDPICLYTCNRAIMNIDVQLSPADRFVPSGFLWGRCRSYHFIGCSDFLLIVKHLPSSAGMQLHLEVLEAIRVPRVV
jgi:hypothetical protein